MSGSARHGGVNEINYLYGLLSYLPTKICCVWGYTEVQQEKKKIKCLIKVLIGFANLFYELGPASNKVIQQCGPLFIMN